MSIENLEIEMYDFRVYKKKLTKQLNLLITKTLIAKKKRNLLDYKYAAKATCF